MTVNTIAAWHDLVQTRNVKGLAALLADNCVFHSPVVHTPQVGTAVTLQYLSAAFHVFFNPSFRYVREVAGANDAVLKFKVMIRPLKAINLIHHKMAAMLQANQ